ncbi:HEAT repeat domain-containing protein [Acidobacteriota bacterium]
MPKDIKNPTIQNKKEELEDYASDIKEIKGAREIVQLIAKTTSQMKIFASDHVNISRFTDELFVKLKVFLEKHRKFDLGVQEFSFTYGGKTVYTDKQIKKSIPFLFYKDGVQSLLFYKDLTKDEFLDFLGIIKKEANLPAEESDIVIALWEKDFANISYFASDEFLESKIGIGMESKEYTYDPDSLVKGKIELDEEDKKALGDAILSEELASEKDDQIKGDLELTEDGMTPLSYALDKAEIKKLEDMLERNRSITTEEELVALIMEMLYLEKRVEPFTDIVDALHQCHNQLLEKENYPLIVHLIQSVIAFKDILVSQEDVRHSVLKTFLDNITSSETLADLQKYITEDQLLAPESLLEYLNILGPKSIPVLSHLYEYDKRPHYRKKVLEVLKKHGSVDIQGLMNVVQDEKPDLARAIISVLREVNGKRSIQHLATFVNYNNSDIRAEAVKALGTYVDMTANKILLAFLKDDDVEMRIQAAQSCQHVCDKALRDHILNTVKSKAFKRKSDEEIQAFLELLGRSQTEQAYQTLRSFLKKAGIITSNKVKEMSLSTVFALESLGTSEARVILEEGTRMHNKRIKHACEKSLQNLTRRH